MKITAKMVLNSAKARGMAGNYEWMFTELLGWIRSIRDGTEPPVILAHMQYAIDEANEYYRQTKDDAFAKYAGEMRRAIIAQRSPGFSNSSLKPTTSKILDRAARIMMQAKQAS